MLIIALIMLIIALTCVDGLVESRIVELLKNDLDFISLPQAKMDIANVICDL